MIGVRDRIRDVEISSSHKTWEVRAHRVSKAVTGPQEAKTRALVQLAKATKSGTQGISKVTCAAQT